MPTSYYRNRIEEYFEDFDWDIVCRKKRNGYAIYWNDDREPLAKLRATGRDDEVEVLQWKDGHWQQVTESGVVLELDEALAFITDDPDELFFDSDSESDEMESAEASAEMNPLLRAIRGRILVWALVGGAVGGAFSGAVAGAAVGILTTVLAILVPDLLRMRWWAVIIKVIAFVPFSAVFAANGGVLGASVQQGMGGGVSGVISGIIVGAICGVFSTTSRLAAWGIGIGAGLMLGLRLMEAVDLPNDILRFGVVAVTASMSANLLTATVRWFRSSVVS